MPEGESGRTKAIKHCTSKWPGPTHATGSDVVLGCAETYHGHLCCPLASLPGSMGTDERKPPRGGGFHSSIAWKSANGLEQRESRPGGLLHSQGSFGAVRLGTLPCAHNFNLARWGGGEGSWLDASAETAGVTGSKQGTALRGEKQSLCSTATTNGEELVAQAKGIVEGRLQKHCCTH